MIVSMTGFGSGAAEAGECRVRVTLRSVNGRYLDTQIRCPNALPELEPKVRERIQSRVSRGKVTGHVECEESAVSGPTLVLNEDAVEQYLKGLARLAEMTSLDEPPQVEFLARLPGVFRSESVPPETEEIGRAALEALDQALDELDHMRQTEGAALVRDIEGRMGLIDENLTRIEELADAGRHQVHERLRTRVEALLESGEVDEERLAMEVVMLAERSDITEEIVRFRSHNSQFMEAVEGGGDVGRRLNFLLQEMNREANTLSSKSSEAQIIHLAVSVKEEIERLREQVQNIA